MTSPDAPNRDATQKLPLGACDCHVQVTPPSLDLSPQQWAENYAGHVAALGCSRGVLVPSPLHEVTPLQIRAALAHLGHSFRAAVPASPHHTAKEIASLASAGVKALTLSFSERAMAQAAKHADAMADHGMHLQIMLRQTIDAAVVADAIKDLPVPVVLDHMGWPDVKKGADDHRFNTLTQLLSEGRVMVKLSALYRLFPPPYDMAEPFIQKLIGANVDGLIWGSDCPYVTRPNSEMPDGGAAMDTVLRVVTNHDDLHKILVDTPAKLFDF